MAHEYGFTCSICGTYNFSTPRGGCAGCYPVWECEVTEGKYPPGLDLDAREYFSFSEWYELKHIELGVRQGTCLPRRAEEMMSEIVGKLNKRAAAQKRLRMAQVQQGGFTLY